MEFGDNHNISSTAQISPLSLLKRYLTRPCFASRTTAFVILSTHLQNSVDEQEIVGGFPPAEVFCDLQRLLALLHPLGDGRGGDHHGEGGR